MWDNLITTGWHPHKILEYEFAWQYALHPIVLLILSILLILIFFWTIIESIEEDEPIFVAGLLGAFFGYLTVPYILIALIYIWPLLVVIATISIGILIYQYIEDRPKKKKVEKQLNYKEKLSQGL